MKKAFTVAETLLTMAIIGFLTVLSLGTIRDIDKKNIQVLYNQAYRTILIAAYNGKEALMAEKAKVASGVLTEADFEEINTMSDEDFCILLTEWINLSANGNAKCDAANVAYSGEDSNFTEANVVFTAANGMKFYMSEKFTTEDTVDEDIITTNHRVVWVDVNGERGPNTAECTRIDKCDIFAFDIVDGENVLPVGYPKLQRGFLKASLSMPYDPDSHSAPKSKIVDSYYALQCMAYGCADGTPNYFPNDIYSITIDDKFGNKIKPAFPNVNQKAECINEPDVIFPSCSLQIEY